MKHVKRLENKSDEKITLDFGCNIKAVLPPGDVVEDVTIANSKELENKASMTFDLTEVNETDGKTKLLD